MSNQNEQQFCLGEYCAIFVDLLGHKKFLVDLSQLKCDQDEAQKRVSELSEPLLRFKEWALKRVKEVLEETHKIITEVFPESFRSQFLNQIDEITCGVQQFSDSTLLYVKMGSPVSYIVILVLLEFVVFRLLDNISRGTPLRGGVAIGQGWELEKNCLCGQVIADAYNLESTVSSWGRIAVSELFVTRLRGFCRCGGHGFVKLLEPLNQILSKDFDGVDFIDYLHPAVDEMYKRNHFTRDWFTDRIEKGLAFINRQRERFYNEASKCPESARLALRYDIMRGYWKSRLEMWANIKEGKGKVS